MFNRCAVDAYSAPKRLLLRRWLSINYLTSSVPKRVKQSSSLNFQNKNDFPNEKPSHLQPPRTIDHMIITPQRLADEFRNEYHKPDGRRLNLSQQTFNNAKIKLEWTLADYNEIPDVKDPKKYTALPEVLFLGHTNSGKSSLINNLLLNSQENRTGGAKTEHAYVSNRAGYTRTMNCFNISNKFRLVDSPGYGEFGLETLGEMVLEYIRSRSLLRRAYILIDSVNGFRHEDLQLIEHLTEQGISFEVIFTKVDMIIQKYMKLNKVERKRIDNIDKRCHNVEAVNNANRQVVEHFRRMVEETGLDLMAALPRILFNNALTNPWLQKRHGYKEIRATVLESCGY